jgi:DNA-binding CsgD family transcriptional regulator
LEHYQSDSENELMAKLTNGQRDCLRLVSEHFSSKEIARVLDISPHTVDQRLKRATNLLDVPTRFEAARMFMRHGAPFMPSIRDDQLYGSLVYQRPDLSDPPHFVESEPSLGTLDRPSDGVGHELHEHQERYFAQAVQTATDASIWSVLVGTQRENELSVQSRIAVMVLIAVFAILGFAALVSVAEGLSRIS